MRIGLLTTSFPRFADDIAGSFVLGYAQALAGRGHTVEVLAPEPGFGASAPQTLGVDLVWVPYARPRTLARTFYGAGVPDNLARDLRAWPGLLSFPLALYRQARRRAPTWDALVSHWAVPSSLVAGSLRGERPHHAVLHSADVHLLERLGPTLRLAPRIVASATSMQFVSDDLRSRFLALLPTCDRSRASAKSRVMPMGFHGSATESSRRTEIRRKLGLTGFVVLALGRLVPIKGIDVAVRAFGRRDATATRTTSGPLAEACLVVAGEGPERRPLQRLATQLQASVRFLGAVHGDDKADLFGAADAFVLPSRRLENGRTEGAPVALLEAMAAGLPCVVAAGHGGAALIEHGRGGLIVPANDPPALVEALSRLAADRSLCRNLGERAALSVAAYEWRRMASSLEAPLLDVAVARHRRDAFTAG